MKCTVCHCLPPPSFATMISSFSKHASLIKKCYPTLPEENQSIPRSSELAYLVYYAQARPEKLKKIGIHLEVKVKNYVWGQKEDRCLVTLKILDALIVACPKELHLLSRNLLTMLTDMYNLKQQGKLLEAMAHTFSLFCCHHTGTQLGVDQSYAQTYASVVGLFAQLCNWTEAGSSVPTLLKCWIGLKALQAVVHSPATHSMDAKPQLKRMIPALVSNIRDPIQVMNHSPLEQSSTNGDEEKDSIVFKVGHIQLEKDPTEEDLNVLAIDCLQQLIGLSSAINVKLAMLGTFRYFDEQGIWASRQYVVDLVQVILAASQAQNRFVVVTEIISQLEMGRSQDAAKKLALISCVEVLLCHGFTFVGVSVLEVLSALIKQLLRSYPSETEEKEGKNPELFNGMRTGLENCIISLGKRVYYAGQVGDVVEDIGKYLKGYLEKQKSPATLGTKKDEQKQEYSEDLSAEQLAALLKCIAGVLDASKKAEKTDGMRFAVPSDLIEESVLALVDHSSKEVRIAAIKALYTYTKSFIEDNKVSKLQHRGFRYTIYKQLYKRLIVKAEDNDVTEYLPDLAIMILFLNCFGDEEMFYTIPLLNKLYRNTISTSCTWRKEQRFSNLAICIKYWQQVGKKLNIPSIIEKAEENQQEMKAAEIWPDWCDQLEAQDFRLDLDISTPMSKVEKEFYLLGYNHELFIVLLEREEGFKSKHHDIHTRLNLDFEQITAPKEDSLENEELKKRIRSSRNFDTMKPRFSIPIYKLLKEAPKTQGVSVENLRNALGANVQRTLSDPSEASTADDSEEEGSLNLYLPKKNRTASQTEVDGLLNSLSLNPRAAKSSVSLITPPNLAS